MKDRRSSDKGTTTKEQILAKLRNAIIEKPEALFEDIDLQSDTWQPIREEDGNAITFVQRFKDMGGIFIYLENEAELGECLHQLAPQNEWDPLWCTGPETQALLEKYAVPFSFDPVKDNKHKLVQITNCEYLVAQTGSILLSDRTTRSRRAYTEPDVLLVIARSHQIVGGLKEAFQRVKEDMETPDATQITVLTGSTRSYDIEQDPVQGIFGPRQIAVFLIDE